MVKPVVAQQIIIRKCHHQAVDHRQDCEGQKCKNVRREKLQADRQTAPLFAAIHASTSQPTLWPGNTCDKTDWISTTAALSSPRPATSQFCPEVSRPLRT